MAILNLGATNELPDAQIPSGYTRPVIATFSDYEFVRTLTLLVPKATVETATASGTMTAIFTNATVGINKQIVDIVAADFLTTPAVTTYGVLKSLTTNINNSDISDTTYLTNVAAAYKCVVKLYIKAI